MDTSDLRARLQRLDEELSYLRSKQKLAPTVQDYVDNVDLKKEVEYSLQIAAQICIDLGNYFVSIYGLTAERLDGIFTALAQAKVLPADLAQWLSAAARFRNIVVHRYLILDPVKVYEIWQNELARFDDFAQVVVALIAKDEADGEEKE